MKINERLRALLDKHKVKYEFIEHPAAYTAQETAEREHVSGRQIAKVVMVKVDGKDVMAVLPASSRLSLYKLKGLLGAKEARIESEEEFKRLFPDCEVGAMPPFGDLYRLPFFVDMSLAENKFILFNAGTHQDSVKMAYRDYAKIAEPDLVEFAEQTS